MSCPTLPNLSRPEIRFWMKTENYKWIPSKVALKLFECGKISTTQLVFCINKCQLVEDDFEQMCEYVVKKYFAERVSEKEQYPNYNWFYFLDFLQYSRSGYLLDMEESGHEARLRECEVLEEAMYRVAGGSAEVVDSVHNRRQLMLQQPEQALETAEHPKWAQFQKLSKVHQTSWRWHFEKWLERTGDQQEAAEYAEERVLAEVRAKRRAAGEDVEEPATKRFLDDKDVLKTKNEIV